MKPKILISAILLLISFTLFSQKKFTITATDGSIALEYPEIQISNVVHQIGTKEGRVEIPRNILNEGDTIRVNHLGYFTNQVITTNKMLEDEGVIIPLKEKVYELNAVEITPDDLNADKLFAKKKKKLLLPYFHDHSFNVKYEYGKGSINIQGLMPCRYKNGNVTLLDSITAVTDSLERRQLQIMIKRGTELNHNYVNIFCYTSQRKNFYCKYKGIENAKEWWKYTLRPGKEKEIKVNPGAELTCLVALNNEGYIVRIETILTETTPSATFVSFLFTTDYKQINRQVIAEHTISKVLPNNYNKRARERTIDMTYLNYQKGKE